MIIPSTIFETIYSGVPSCDNAKDYLEAIRQKFKESDKVRVANLLNSFSNSRYDNKGDVRNSILEIVQVASRLRDVNIPISDTFVVYCLLETLEMDFEQLKVSYIALTEVEYSWADFCMYIGKRQIE